MDYKETLNWLFSQLPMYQRVGKAAYKADLDTTIQLLEKLGNPQDKFKVLHVAGTNGKGSVAHMLASILQEAGYRTGLYTSPHLKDFRERIKINGEMIPEEKVVEFVVKHKDTFDQLQPSFFEMTVAMAYDHFAKEKIDFAVLETGMGGRLDSTNVSNPVVSVITNIGHDHIQFLGDDAEKIAREKAGIIKNGIPVVVGEKQHGISEIFEEIANGKNTSIIYADEHFDLKPIQRRDKTKLFYDVWYNNEMYIENLISPLLALYQIKNIKTSLQVIELLNVNKTISITRKDIADGIERTIENTNLMGRWQILSTNPLTICDTGHNPEGIQAVIDQINQTRFSHLHFVFGMVNDKIPEKILYLLPKDATYYFCKPDIPRGMDANELREHAFKAGLNGKSYSSVTEALNVAVNNAGVNDLVFVGGSTFVVAEII
ncbi:MAG: bifunctional folylpolyglutamate synthase/dihydrofolate synthase [Bacteroidetes bacterium]|nr:MAG: bifunctional folylpolyglutamate synthase/dihydrofolate synthase [Bacteroidota bacterium]RLD44748.1 MAG: bifunctional folylpolyglutamate synthase/dihydrofolate synthase [Bacteroidota bacterium]RLD74308.1 MAG: bifunctional folylpolyglutamate synthase/dihydrofolate synthase [Bacteroidota bacterium]RLD87614.1 MAG: bifunctional folylpolyglutamate synthase/dihydrofolate synthase [Bacteroidota bacterium]